MQSCISQRRLRLLYALAALAVLGALLLPAAAGAQKAGVKPQSTADTFFRMWHGFARNAQHTAQAIAASQPFTRIKWQTPMDLNPQYSGSELLIHYGSPITTDNDTLIIPVKTGATDGFQIEAHRNTDGSLLYTLPTDYTLPPHNWTPSYGPALRFDELIYPGAGGTIYIRTRASETKGKVTQLAFYGLSNYQANPSAYNSTVFICTPLTVDVHGNLYFGFVVTGSNPINLTGGLARISRDGVGSWVSAAAATGDGGVDHVQYNSAPAVSPDGATVYACFTNGFYGYLVGLNSSTLATIYPATQLTNPVPLLDPVSGYDALIIDDSTSSPSIGPNGDVYFGVLEDPFPYNNDRGWLLHFDKTLATAKTPGAFGWDYTAAFVPSEAVPSYKGKSHYLIACKYNNYIQFANGENKVAVLDPFATETDPVTGGTVMNEVLTMLGQTANPAGGVDEWCINTMAVDPFTKSILVNSEDGKLYRWDLTTNTLSEKMTLTAGLGEAYTPTVVGGDGTVYAINNAIIFAIGR
ncbi:MAG TPA: hypothetical protein VKT32_12870 [Chthonomonadaceae bacterium]|nr:hypothetical protein [Chthonomonadaceae bacterium]